MLSSVTTREVDVIDVPLTVDTASRRSTKGKDGCWDNTVVSKGREEGRSVVGKRGDNTSTRVFRGFRDSTNTMGSGNTSQVSEATTRAYRGLREGNGDEDPKGEVVVFSEESN